MPGQGSALEIARRIRTGESSAVEQIEAAREACERHNPGLGAFVALDWDSAARQAAEIDSAVAKGEDPGPLGGVPFGVKDLQNLAGFVTGRGSRLHANDDPAGFDSPSVERLRRAGAIPVGKTATAEFGMNSATTTPAYGTARNPWNRELTPGGSSGGSAAAVSAGIVAFGTGSDEGGSIRSPASFCGLVGLKPTHGLVPRDDGLFDTNTVGVLTRTVADSAALLDVMAGSCPQDKMTHRGQPPQSCQRAMTATRVDGLRACWSPDLGYAAAEPDIIARARDSAFRLAEAAQFELHEVTCCGDLAADGVTNMGRNAPGLRRIADQTKLKIVAGTGFYLEGTHPDYVRTDSADELAARMVRDITEGIGGTDVRAGIIGEIGTSTFTEREQKVLRACARAHLATGAVISLHTHVGCPTGEQSVRLLQGEGVPADRIIVGHMDENLVSFEPGLAHLDYHRRTAASVMTTCSPAPRPCWLRQA